MNPSIPSVFFLSSSLCSGLPLYLSETDVITGPNVRTILIDVGPPRVQFVAKPGFFVSDSRGPEAQLIALERLNAEIFDLKAAEPEKAFARLGEIVRKTSRENIYQVEKRWEVHRAAKEALLARSGYREYIQTRLKNAKRDLRDAGDENAYDDERSLLFQTMSLLPSPEIVETLGDLLGDDEDAPAPFREGQDYVDMPANSKLAATALGKMIEKPPAQGNPNLYFKHEIETWKLWYAQVKAGTRGFQFKGDPQIYYLAKSDNSHGPAANANQSSPIPAPIARKAEPVATTVPSKRPFPLIGTLIALGLLLLSLGWMIFTKRRARTRSA